MEQEVLEEEEEVFLTNEDKELLKKFRELDDEDEKRLNPQQQDHISHVQVKRYKREQLEKFKQHVNFDEIIKRENEKCANDILYCLFRRPQTIAPFLVDKLHQLALKKNAPDLGQSRIFRDAMDFLINNKRASYKILTFQILLFICREEEAQAIIQELNQGKQQIGHLNTFVIEFSKYIDEVFKMSFGEGNMLWIVNNFVITAELMYMSK